MVIGIHWHSYSNLIFHLVFTSFVALLSYFYFILFMFICVCVLCARVVLHRQRAKLYSHQSFEWLLGASASVRVQVFMLQSGHHLAAGTQTMCGFAHQVASIHLHWPLQPQFHLVVISLNFAITRLTIRFIMILDLYSARSVCTLFVAVKVPVRWKPKKTMSVFSYINRLINAHTKHAVRLAW